jgi:hypothetical protein
MSALTVSQLPVTAMTKMELEAAARDERLFVYWPVGSTIYAHLVELKEGAVEPSTHPTLYDVAIHGERQATQDDVDRLMRLGAEWVKCRDALRKALDDMQAAIIAPL